VGRCAHRPMSGVALPAPRARASYPRLVVMGWPRGKASEVEEHLGAGTTGTVFLARQRSLGRRVAIKELAPELAADPW
jgi:serine/threonine protein kinase